MRLRKIVASLALGGLICGTLVLAGCFEQVPGPAYGSGGYYGGPYAYGPAYT